MQRIIPILLIISFLLSCTIYRQVYEVDSPDIILYDNDYFVDTSTTLDIIYDFWSEGGIPIIELVNDAQDTILVDFKKSYFNLNNEVFSFASKSQKDSIRNYSNDQGYNVMYGEMPGSVLIPPDSSFVFEAVAWNYNWSQEVTRKKPQKRYLYSSSPLKMDHAFVYRFPSNDSSDSLGVRTDTVIHRMYTSEIKQLEYKEYSTLIRSIPLSNKFYIQPESTLSFDEKYDIAETLLELFKGGR